MAETPRRGKKNPLKTCSNAIVNALEGGFYRLGKVIGSYPVVVLVVCFVLLAAMLPGVFISFYQENRAEKLWIASDARAIQDKKFVDLYYPDPGRFSVMIITAKDNVLTPSFLRAMLDQDKKVKAINDSTWYEWDTICIKLGRKCWSNSLLELWQFDETRINNLTQQDIIDTINTAKFSPTYGRDFNATDWLGETTVDSNGNVVAAKATKMIYWIKYNISVVDGEEVDERADAWEKRFLDIAETSHREIENSYRWSFRSFSDEGGSTIFGDVQLLSAGYMLIFVFVTVVLGRFNCVQHRAWCSLAGIVAVGIAMGVTIGIMSYAELMWTPLHSTLPFLLIGIGVDDMFVIVQALENLSDEERRRPVAERIGLTMKSAGVAITVTSMTDILAFAAGAVTVLPALKSFCGYCAIGILLTFLMQTFFFTACLALDLRRVDASRNACCCCYVHRDYEPNACSQRSLMQEIFGNVIGFALTKLPVKILVVVATLALLGLGISGTVLIEQEFDPLWFIADDSYASEYFDADKRYFPSDGFASGHVYIGAVAYYEEWSKLQTLYDDVYNDAYIDSSTVDCWYRGFALWMNNNTDPNNAPLLSNGFAKNETSFYTLVSRYLFSEGSRFRRDLVFEDNTNQKLQASRFLYYHRALDGSAEEIAAMDRMRDLTRQSGFGEDLCFPYSRFYLTFSTNKVIRNELYRNLGLAFVCVFVMTLFLIANLWTCILVGLCVIMTLVDVMGTAHFWDQTIDTVLAIQLIVAIGLAVDYSAHIGHFFMTVTGTKNERVKKTMYGMGAAVFYGGFSTFLAFILLAASQSYIFRTFFKIFFCVVLYGLLHGLLFLPVLLSWVGPSPYDSAYDGDVHPDEKVPPDAAVQSGTEKPGVNEYKNGSPARVNPACTSDENLAWRHPLQVYPHQQYRYVRSIQTAYHSPLFSPPVNETSRQYYITVVEVNG